MPRSARLLYVILATTDTVLAATGQDSFRRLTKPFLMPVLMIDRDPATRRALAFGAVGDVALLGSGDAAFKVGLGGFLVGHLAWVAALRSRSSGWLKNRLWLTVPYLVAWGGLNAYLWRRTGRDRVPVLLYSTALLATALVALDTGNPVTAVGGSLFLASDALIALDRFADVELPFHEGVVMASYTAAQALLAQT